MRGSSSSTRRVSFLIAGTSSHRLDRPHSSRRNGGRHPVRPGLRVPPRVPRRMGLGPVGDLVPRVAVVRRTEPARGDSELELLETQFEHFHGTYPSEGGETGGGETTWLRAPSNPARRCLRSRGCSCCCGAGCCSPGCPCCRARSAAPAPRVSA